MEGDDWRGGCCGWRAGEGDGNVLRHDEQRHEGEGKQRQAADGEDGPGQQQSEVIGMAGLMVVVLLQMVRLIKVLLVIDGDSLVSVEGHVFRGEERRTFNVSGGGGGGGGDRGRLCHLKLAKQCVVA